MGTTIDPDSTGWQVACIGQDDGNPLNEVRLLCQVRVVNHNRLGVDKTIQYEPAKSVLKLRIGDEIKLNEADFIKLASAFFADIEKKYL